MLTDFKDSRGYKDWELTQESFNIVAENTSLPRIESSTDTPTDVTTPADIEPYSKASEVQDTKSDEEGESPGLGPLLRSSPVRTPAFRTELLQAKEESKDEGEDKDKDATSSRLEKTPSISERLNLVQVALSAPHSISEDGNADVGPSSDAKTDSGSSSHDPVVTDKNLPASERDVSRDAEEKKKLVEKAASVASAYYLMGASAALQLVMEKAPTDQKTGTLGTPADESIALEALEGETSTSIPRCTLTPTDISDGLDTSGLEWVILITFCILKILLFFARVLLNPLRKSMSLEKVNITKVVGEKVAWLARKLKDAVEEELAKENKARAIAVGKKQAIQLEATSHTSFSADIQATEKTRRRIPATENSAKSPHSAREP